MIFALATSTAVIVVLIVVVFVWFHTKMIKSPPVDAKFFQNLLLGHRGARRGNFAYTENSLDALDYCHKRGCDGVEFDVQLSKDNEMLIFHDSQSIGELCHLNGKQDKPVGDIDFKDVKTFLLKKHSGTHSQGNDRATIPSFDEFITFANSINPKMKLMVELKEWDPKKCWTLAQKMSAAFKKYDLYERAVCGSFCPIQLYYVRKIDPKIATNFIYENNVLKENIDAPGNHCPNYKPFNDYKKKQGFNFYFLWLFKGIIDKIIWLGLISNILPYFLKISIIGLEYNTLYKNPKYLNMFKKRGYVINAWVVNHNEGIFEGLGNEDTVITDYIFREDLGRTC